jgi:uncharacterized protein YbaR (Trm112 family)/SAM-dependent methyltransferase
VKTKLLDLLACPECHQDLRMLASEREGSMVERGTLVCGGCDRRFEIRDGVPRFTTPRGDDASVVARFDVEFSAGASDGRDLDEPDLLAFVFLSRTGFGSNAFDLGLSDWYPTEVPGAFEPDWSEVEGKSVLDGGCGPGRFLPLLAPHAETVVGLELGPHVDRAAQRCRHLDNVHVVQGSVLAPPFKEKTFDTVYSLGVLHHTPDPAGGARALAALVGTRGKLALWVYPPGYWGRGIRRLSGRAIHAWLSRRQPEAAYRVVKRRLYPLGKLQARAARNRWTKLACAPLYSISVPRHPVPEVMVATIYDYFVPPIISTHTADELCDWLTDEGFAAVEVLPVPTSIQAMK